MSGTKVCIMFVLVMWCLVCLLWQEGYVHRAVNQFNIGYNSVLPSTTGNARLHVGRD